MSEGRLEGLSKRLPALTGGGADALRFVDFLGFNGFADQSKEVTVAEGETLIAFGSVTTDSEPPDVSSVMELRVDGTPAEPSARLVLSPDNVPEEASEQLTVNWWAVLTGLSPGVHTIGLAIDGSEAAGPAVGEIVVFHFDAAKAGALVPP